MHAHDRPDRPDPARRARKIVLCHLESIVGLPALNILFNQFGSDIGLVLSSRRFGPPHGGPIRQLARGVRQWGWRLTLWLGFDIIAAQLVGRLARWTRFLRSQPPSLATLPELAERHGSKLIKVANINAPSNLDVVRQFAPDLVLVMNFDQILQPSFIGLARLGVINIHPSLLPKLRGPCPAFWTIAEDHEAGASLHFIEDEKIDAGRVIHQCFVPRLRMWSVGELTTVLFERGAAALPEAIARIEAGPNAGHAQDLRKAEYRSFPNRTAMAMARRQGLRLFRMVQLLRLIGAATGVTRW